MFGSFLQETGTQTRGRQPFCECIDPLMPPTTQNKN
jgi:hypothetical protein